jgi:hypothetical protein
MQQRCAWDDPTVHFAPTKEDAARRNYCRVGGRVGRERVNDPFRVAWAGGRYPGLRPGLVEAAFQAERDGHINRAGHRNGLVEAAFQAEEKVRCASSLKGSLC